MRVKSYYKWTGSKRYGPYFVKYDEKGRSTHVKIEEYIRLHRVINEEKELKKKRKLLKDEKPDKYYSDDLCEIFKICGWKVRGSRITMDIKTFFTLESCSNRFELLDPESQKRIGSPIKYLQFTKAAWKLHKTLNALQRSNTLAGCLATVLAEWQAKKTPTALHS